LLFALIVLRWKELERIRTVTARKQIRDGRDSGRSRRRAS
jgi:hypothetical protein